MSRLADIPDDRHECSECGAGFKRRAGRREHLRDAHPETLPEGAAACSCAGDAEPDVSVVRDSQAGRDREVRTCPRCGDRVSGGGFA
jgi:ribosomal protein S27AE